MILPRGITGFGVPKGHSYAAPRSFHADCRQAVAPLNGRVEDRKQVFDVGSASFLARVLVMPGEEVAALLNKVHPWVGFCRPLEPGRWPPPEFVDPRRVDASFVALDRYRVLSCQELDRPVDEAMCAELRRVELDQLKYWSKLAGRRLRVGEVVFNIWD